MADNTNNGRERYHCRTLKYLQGLALDIPCLSYDWLKECIKQVRDAWMKPAPCS